MFILLLRWIALAASMSFLLVYFKGGTVIVKDTRREVATTGSHVYLSFVIVMFLAGLTILVAQLLLCLGVISAFAWAEHWGMVTLGTGMLITGILLSFWVRSRHLGRFWSGIVELQKDHEVVEKGSYHIVRHPIYALTLAIYTGAALAFGVWWNWIACGVMVVGYIWLTAYEDRFLAANLDGYREYRQRTPYRLMPGIW